MNIWDEHKRLQSSNENVAKYIFKKDDALAEAVLYKYPTYEDRTVMCISVMSGCPMGCTFCGTGKFFGKCLSADEIVEQVFIMIKDKGLDPAKINNWQIMTMSMGEPLLNLPELQKALRLLNHEFPQAKLLISTSAPKLSKEEYDDFMQFCTEIDTVGLQFSVHESTDEARDRLVPFKNKMNLAEMAMAGETFFQATGRHPFFNYCVHEGNNSSEDVARLLDLYDPKVWQATVSVICEKDESVSQALDRQRELADMFEQQMISAGYSTRVFDPAGQDDIGGGCGQLWHVQKWAEENPDKVRRSIGALND